MHRRQFWIKLSLCGIVATLILGLILIVWMHWFAGGDGGHHHNGGRALQTASPPPPSPPGPPPSPTPPPLFLTPRDSSKLGAGLVILIIVGSLSLAACLAAIPRSLVVRFAVWTLATLLSLATALVLLLMPRDPPPTNEPEDDKITDISTIGRIFLVSVAAFFALISLGAVLVVHVVAPQKAPKVVEDMPVEAYRLRT